MDDDGKVEIELELDDDIMAYINQRVIETGLTIDEVVENILQLVIDEYEENNK